MTFCYIESYSDDFRWKSHLIVGQYFTKKYYERRVTKQMALPKNNFNFNVGVWINNQIRHQTINIFKRYIKFFAYMYMYFKEKLDWGNPMTWKFLDCKVRNCSVRLDFATWWWMNYMFLFLFLCFRCYNEINFNYYGTFTFIWQ